MLCQRSWEALPPCSHYWKLTYFFDLLIHIRKVYIIFLMWQVRWVIWGRLCSTTVPTSFETTQRWVFITAWETVLGKTSRNPSNALPWKCARVTGLGNGSSTDQRTPGVFYLLCCRSVRSGSWNWLDLGLRVILRDEYAGRESDSIGSPQHSWSWDGKTLFGDHEYTWPLDNTIFS